MGDTYTYYTQCAPVEVEIKTSDGGDQTFDFNQSP
jgi:hypothetical protein